MALQPSKLTLYNRVFSTCSARIRIAACLKDIPLEIVEVHGQNTGRKDPTYLSKNPNGSVPTLVAEYLNGESVTLTESLTMLEFLDESYPGTLRLIPPITDMTRRCQVKDLSTLIACRVESTQTSGLLNTIRKDLGGNTLQWVQKAVVSSMKYLELVLERSAATYSVGNEVSIADVCLVPLVQRAYQFGLTLDNKSTGDGYRSLPTVGRIVRECEKLEAFRRNGVPKYAEGIVIPKYTKDYKAMLRTSRERREKEQMNVQLLEPEL
jgi:maleylacetoacetate isomerase